MEGGTAYTFATRRNEDIRGMRKYSSYSGGPKSATTTFKQIIVVEKVTARMGLESMAAFQFQTAGGTPSKCRVLKDGEDGITKMQNSSNHFFRYKFRITMKTIRTKKKKKHLTQQTGEVITMCLLQKLTGVTFQNIHTVGDNASSLFM